MEHHQTDNLANTTNNVIRILLGKTASSHLSGIGSPCFAVVGKDTYPGDPSRWVIYLMPTTIEAANAATRVALGKARAVPIKTASPKPSNKP